MNPRDKDLLQRIRADDKQALEEIYLNYQADFLRMAGNQGFSASDDALDIYQDVVIAFYQQVLQGTSTINTSIRAYLLAMGRYKCYERRKDKQRAAALLAAQAEATMPEDISLSYEQEQLRRHFPQLSESCQEVLRLFYYRGLSLTEIVALTAYKNTTTVKSHKSRCLKRLSELIKG